MKKNIIIIVFMVLVVSAGVFIYLDRNGSDEEKLFYSGTIEATQAKLSFQVPGRIAAVHVREGQGVTKGHILAELDRSELEARHDQARANLVRAETAQEQARTALSIYEKTLPAEVARAEAGLKTAADMLVDARKNYERFEELFRKNVIAEKERDSMKLNYEVARSRLAEAESVLHLARGNLARIEGARQDIEAAAAGIEAAAAVLNQTAIQMEYARLQSPMDGVVTSRNIEPGETVTAGREVITLSDLSRVDLKIFVEETRIGEVKPGQNVSVTVDTFPGKVYEGAVSFISPEGEFTPKFIQTQKERVKLVYLVKVSIDNPRHELKTGMPADALLRQ